MMRLVLVQGDAGGLADLRRAAIGADDQPGAGLDAFSVLLEGHRRRRAEGQGGHRHPPPGVRAGAQRGVEQGLAVQRVAQAQRSRHVGGKDAQRQDLARRHRRILRFVIGDVPRQMVAAGPEQQVIEADPAGLDHAPRGDPLAAHPVNIGLRLFEQQHRTALAGHDGGQGRTANASAHNRQVVGGHVSSSARLRCRFASRLRRFLCGTQRLRWASWPLRPRAASA